MTVLVATTILCYVYLTNLYENKLLITLSLLGTSLVYTLVN